MQQGSPISTSLGYNAVGTIRTLLPQGPAYNNYTLTISVHVIDDSNGIKTFTIPTPIQAKKANDTYVTGLINQLLNASTTSSLNQVLQGGDLQQTTQTVSNMIAFLNSLSVSAKLGVSQSCK
jgi:hypothetical protein